MSGVAVSTSSAVPAAKGSEALASTSAPPFRAASDVSEFKKTCGNLTYKSYFSVGSLLVEVEIPLDRLASSPPWNAGNDEEPQLPPGEAVRLSKSELRRLVKDEDEWYFVNLSLVPTCGSRAYYEVGWQREANGKSFNLTIPVLLSGEAVPTGRAIKEARARAFDGAGLR
jgi:hypothetical protein